MYEERNVSIQKTIVDEYLPIRMNPDFSLEIGRFY